MTIEFSTADIHPRERVAYWREVATKSYVPHDFSSCVRAGFSGNLRMNSIGDLGVSSFECDPCEVQRTSAHVRQGGGGGDLLVNLLLDGCCIARQGEREAELGPAMLCLIDSSQPYSLSIPVRSKALVIKAPRRNLEARLGRIAEYSARAVDCDAAAGGLASGLLRLRPETFDGLEGPATLALAEASLNLIALVLVSGFASTPVSTARANALLRLKAAIESNLWDPELKPELAASAAGMSVRYANSLLAMENSSLERFILHRRLERCRRTFNDPAHAHRTTGEIAFSWGFSDLSHFGRRFKERYGLAPSDYRRRPMETQPTN